MPANTSPDIYFRAAQVRHRYDDASDMWLHRRLHDAVLPMPQPIYINGRRFWKLRDLEAWDAALAAAPPNPRPTPPPTERKVRRARS
jgi:hypothetical protein